jgi:hypothetical protein
MDDDDRDRESCVLFHGNRILTDNLNMMVIRARSRGAWINESGNCEESSKEFSGTKISGS